MSDADGKKLVTSSLIEDGTLLDILFDNPKGNVLTMAVMDEIAQLLDAHESDQHLRLVMLRGAGKHFSFGVSVAEHVADLAPKMLASFHALLRKIAAYPVPVGAVVQGHCLGGAFEVVLCCHFVFATPNAAFACPEVKLAVFPPILAAIGAHRLGGALAERLLLTGDTIDAQGAAAAGLVTGFVGEDGDPKQDVVAWYKKNLRPLSAKALRFSTRAFRQASGLLDQLGAPLEAIERFYLDEVLSSADANEGIASFMERRAPTWKDE